MGREIVDGLTFGNFGDFSPELELPLDIGDGPFASPAVPRGTDIVGAAQADSATLEMEDQRVEDLVERGRRQVSLGTVFVSDIIPGNSFRRVQHDVNIPSNLAEAMAQDLSHAITIRFQGAAGAVLAEKINGSGGNVPGANIPEILFEMLDMANRAAQNESTNADGAVDLRRPLPPSQSFYVIQFHQPALEFSHFDPGRTFDPSMSTGMARENEVHEFRFNVDGRRSFEMRYPVGACVPVVFDIINRGGRSISADLYVEVLISAE